MDMLHSLVLTYLGISDTYILLTTVLFTNVSQISHFRKICDTLTTMILLTNQITN